MTSAFDDISIDAVRAYWDSRPCNIRHSPAPVGTREYFEQVEARKYYVEPHIPAFAQFDHWNEQRVLELGCGIGTDTVNFARAGARVTACDLSPASLALARKHAEVMGVADRVTFVLANGEALHDEVPIEPYDLVYSFGVVHHSPHPDVAVRELGRYLAPGGTLKLMVYHRRSSKVAGVFVRDAHLRPSRLRAAVARHSEAQTGCPVTYVYSRREAVTLARLAGVKIDEVSVDHIFPYRVADYVEYRYRRRLYWRAVPAPLFRRFEHRFGWHLLLTGHREQ
jgi:2-polyprenyl-3-methyl-5-hydroxy-6-metoxy-1,4-benzoquinol methylase